MPSVDRRWVLRAMGTTAAIATGSGLLAACGSNDQSSAPQSGATGTPKKGGNLRVALAAGAATETLDPHKMAVFPDWAHGFQLYDLLTYPDPTTYELQNHLADEISANSKGDVWTVRLKQGVEFHNGKTLTSEDLIFSVNRILKGYPASSLYFIDPKGMKKMDERTVQFKLPKPYAVFAEAFGGSSQWIVPVGFDPAKPVGTGPFKLTKFTPGDRSTWAANPNYWGVGPYVDTLELIDINDDTARVNALLGGQVDVIQSLPFDQIASVKGNAAVKVLDAETVAWSPIVMRIDKAPFDDVRVRQAFRLIANRPQLVEQAFLGYGTVANDLFQQFDPAYIGNDLAQRVQDIEKAKSLLAQAGQSNLNTEMVVANLSAGIVPGAQAFVEQAKQAGVTINLRQIEAGDFYGPNYLSYPLTIDINISTCSYLTTCALWTAPNAPYDSTHMSTDKQYSDLYYQASATMDDARRKQLEGQMQQIEYDRGGFLNYGWGHQVDAYSSKVTGFLPDKMGWPLTSFGFNRVWFT
jgi:peptide/nickel transport system substrate-binding protein